MIQWICGAEAPSLTKLRNNVGVQLGEVIIPISPGSDKVQERRAGMNRVGLNIAIFGIGQNNRPRRVGTGKIRRGLFYTPFAPGTGSRPDRCWERG